MFNEDFQGFGIPYSNYVSTYLSLLCGLGLDAYPGSRSQSGLRTQTTPTTKTLPKSTFSQEDDLKLPSTDENPKEDDLTLPSTDESPEEDESQPPDIDIPDTNDQAEEAEPKPGGVFIPTGNPKYHQAKFFDDFDKLGDKRERRHNAAKKSTDDFEYSRGPSKKEKNASIILEQVNAILVDFLNAHDDINCLFSLENVTEPKSIQQAFRDPKYAAQWKAAAEKEINDLKRNSTWKLIRRSELPPGTKVHRPIWRFKLKLNGTFKARLCFDGRFQVHGKDVWETFSPVPNFDMVRMVITIMLQRAVRIVQADIPNAFLHPDTDIPVYMEQPEGFKEGDADLVCEVLKSLYGMKQASRLWNSNLSRFLIEVLHLSQSKYCHCVFVGRFGKVWAIVLLYVDDLLLSSNSTKWIDEAIECLRKKYGVRFEEGINTYLGMKCELDPTSMTVFMSQEHIIDILIQKTRVEGKKTTRTPSNPKLQLSTEGDLFTDLKQYRSVIGTALWLARCTRPDIMFQVILLSQFQCRPTVEHWGALQHLARYLMGTRGLGITLNQKGSPDMIPYFDAGHQNPQLQVCSVSGALIMFGGSPISWGSSIQKGVKLSTTESEYYAISEGMRVVVWMKNSMEEIAAATGLDYDILPVVKTDSKTAIDIIRKRDPEASASVRHLKARVHWIFERFDEDGDAVIQYVESKKNLSDIMTKSFGVYPYLAQLRDQILTRSKDQGEC